MLRIKYGSQVALLKWCHTKYGTTCTLMLGDGFDSAPYLGHSFRSQQDSPNKEVGRKISLTRALKQANLSGSSIQRSRMIGARLAGAVWIDGKICSATSVGACE